MPEQIEVGAAVHLAFEQFELGTLSFDLALAPFQGQASLLGRPVPFEALYTPSQLRDAARAGLCHPDVYPLRQPLADWNDNCC